MSRYHAYLSTATKLIKTYKAGSPLVHHLKAHFSANKKMGSKDRKIVAALCYHYFRCKSLFKNEEEVGQVVVKSAFICDSQGLKSLLADLSPELHSQSELSLDQRLAHLNLDKKNLFALEQELSDYIDSNLFAQSFLQQSFLFLRIRPGKEKIVLSAVEKNSINFQRVNEQCVQLPVGVDVSSFLTINKDAVIQDLNSQQVMDGLLQFLNNTTEKSKWSVWDTCAASGGKSILIYDLLKGKVKLTVSDIRKNILNNLDARLSAAGINIYNKFTADLSVHSGLDTEDKFDIVICDAPCTGSGTWARTPEQQYAVTAEDIEAFASRQLGILNNILPHVSPGGLLVYITCSVFVKENEAVVEAFLKQNKSIKVIQHNYYKGYELGADTLFSAVISC